MNYMAFSVDSWFLDLGSERFKAVSVTDDPPRENGH